MRTVMTKIEKVAPVPRPVLVLGPRGTGKELVARAIHMLSPRASEPFITINCAAVAESLLESELFGHEEGAFTGATKQKEGKFELADGGTLFLDEIGNMSLDFQAKILRVLEYQRFERVAGSESIQVNVRVIAATNADLKQAMAAGKFRPDLYDRLAFEVIHLPSLSQRLEDVPVLAAYFLARFRQDVAGITVKEISAEAFDRLAQYDYPGNVRELKNVVERAVYMAPGRGAARRRRRGRAAARGPAGAGRRAPRSPTTPRLPLDRARRRVRGLAVQGRARAHAVQAEGSRGVTGADLRSVPPALPQVRPREGLSYTLPPWASSRGSRAASRARRTARSTRRSIPRRSWRWRSSSSRRAARRRSHELVSYKATAKTLDADMEKYRAKAAEWEKRAMMAVKAGDDEAAKIALKKKRDAEAEATKIERDKHEAASYAIQLNKSRKEFETKLQILKLRKGTLANQIAAARSPGGDAFGNDSSVWDKFKAAEDRIDAEAIETEVDAAMRGEESDAQAFDAKLAAATRNADLLPAGAGGPDDALSELKAKMEADKAAKAKALAAPKDDKK